LRVLAIFWLVKESAEEGMILLFVDEKDDNPKRLFVSETR
jgi:hypothetical protein